MRFILLLGLLLTSLSVAPASPDRTLVSQDESPPTLSALADARYRAAIKTYDETWSYFQQARIDSYQVYVWSRIALDSRREIVAKKADRVRAFEEHLERMQKLETLIKKVRRIGFTRSYDAAAAAYYRLEAELWLARENKTG
jgi:hypothetical protein